MKGAPLTAQPPKTLSGELLDPVATEEISLPATGRPSLYVTHCDAIDELVLECGRQGYSVVQMAAALGVPGHRLTRWEEQHPRFKEVMDTARTYSQAWWEGRAMDGTAASLIGPAVWAKSVSARFPNDYTDRTEQKQALTVHIEQADSDL